MTILWHGGKPWGICGVCGKPVCLNKPLLGDLHLCLTDCEKRGHHVLVPKVSRRFFFWKTTRVQCRDCNMVRKAS